MYKPQPNHDEQARQDFVATWRAHLAANIQPGNSQLFAHRLEPSFEARHGRKPNTVDEVKTLMEGHSCYQFWSAMQRRSQEMMWQSVAEPALRQRQQLVDDFRSLGTNAETLGSLTLDPDLAIPLYHRAADIHIQPGGYHSDTCPDDVTAGVLYETGLPIYIGGALGPDSDLLGKILVKFAQQYAPQLKPARILDLGCAVGNSTLPWVDAYPDSEVHGIDVAAPCLRYGHARAEEKRKSVHFAQQNAEHTHFPDQHFDLVVSHIVLHETSRTALSHIFAECRRLLKPGGVMAHLEIPRGEGAFQQFMYSWETYNNNEHFARLITNIDLRQTAADAGFADANVELTDFDPGFSDKQINYSEQPMAWPILVGQV
ncbi:MAG: class I SAM-dependent methyltransferase [Lysobacterales bacterium]